jgi:hypothetical protein
VFTTLWTPHGVIKAAMANNPSHHAHGGRQESLLFSFTVPGRCRATAFINAQRVAGRAD